MAAEELQRRYTDQEVALVLQRAAELEERRARAEPAGRGVSRREIEAIAREVGFSLESLDAALAELQDGAPLRSRSPLGPAPSAKRVAAVRGRMTESDLTPLVRLVEERVAAAGTVTEALGTVRWTSVASGHNLSPITQVAFTPGDDETHIQVTRRWDPPLRVLVNLLPGMWAGIIGLAVAGSIGLATLGTAAAIAGTAAGGLAIGRAVWHAIARRNAAHVDRLTADLAEEARRIATRPAGE